MVVIIRLVLYIDLIFTDRLGPAHTNPDGKTINTMVSVDWSLIYAHANIHIYANMRSPSTVIQYFRKCMCTFIILHWKKQH